MHGQPIIKIYIRVRGITFNQTQGQFTVAGGRLPCNTNT